MKVVASLLLAAYGSAGVLGYGLHSLWHVHHQGCLHTQPSGAYTAASDYSNWSLRNNYDHPNAQECAVSVVADRSGENATADACPICLLLSQAQQPSFEYQFEHYVATVEAPLPAPETRFPLFLPELRLARGPPQC